MTETLARTPAHLRQYVALQDYGAYDEIDQAVWRFGWGAVCVDGFNPPRAFQEFQALRILPIAGAIRTQEHLAYTPAPDILHEAAGHAPILPDAAYRAYLERFGEIGQRAFSSPHVGLRAAAVAQSAMTREGGSP